MPCHPRFGTRRRRPVLPCALAFAAGIWVARTGFVAESALVFLLVALTLYLFAEVDQVGLLAVLGFAVLGAARFEISQAVYSPHDLRLHSDSAGRVILYGRVEGEPEVRPAGTRLILRADSVLYPDSLKPRSGRVLARFKFDPGLTPGSRVKLWGRLKPPPDARNPGDFSWSDYCLQRDLCALFEPAQGSPILDCEPGGPGWLGNVIAPLRRAMKNALAAHLDGEEAALSVGLLLGEREELSAETIDAFKNTGTLHLLAVSGSNVGVVVSVVWGLLLFVRTWRPIRLLLSAVAVILFCFLAHREDSVVRASVAGLLVLGALALRRRPDAINLWGCTLLLVLAWDPLALFGVGLQLSFGATLGILLAAPMIPSPAGLHGWRKLQRIMAAGLLVSSAAQAATLPVLARAFNEVPLVTPLANLLCVPLAGAATSAGVLTLLLSPFGNIIHGLASAAMWLCLRLLLWSVVAFERIGIPVADLASPDPMEVALYACVLLATRAFWYRPQARRRVLLCTALGMAALVAWMSLAPTAAPEVLVAGGPALNALVRLPDGSVWLVSGDPESDLTRASGMARQLGWSSPRGRIYLEAAGEGGAPTSRKQEGWIRLEESEPAPSPKAALVWCRADDSLPVAVTITHGSSAVVIHRSRPPTLAGLPVELQDVILVTDRSGSGPAPIPPGGVQTTLLAGSARLPEGPDSVQALHTRRHGAIRILWRDGTFHAEPSIR